ncbi:MAG: hypothetical protein JW744_05515 [Candidatus Diapherotrites archaeon]|uniref:Uncharacterized protein n=1 Tax=Candidatus Iainarchaeum sp. TaxID=3101447 RepID=A0A938YPH6_9ARCH|nr:hypothetical protein [Candidatus Diapherotrites archaeon]
MSLFTLTFGSGREKPVYSEIEVVRPSDSIRVDPSKENKVEVKKACTFFKCPGVYIVGEVVSGVVKENMVGSCNGKQFEIEEVEGKFGNAGKEGMNIGMSVSGISLEDLKKGDVISLSPAE